jgi:hypothetical protein
MKRLCLALAIFAALLCPSADAQIGITYFPGPGMPAASGGGGGCGTGTINLSQGCPMPMLGGVL